jgi:ABC-2 type transport system permease protein
MRVLADTWTMTKRSLRHTMRSLDTIITVVLTPIALLLLFVYVFGGALGEQTGSIEYVDFITPRDHHHDGDQRHRLYRAASQHGPPEGHHQPLPDHAGGALVGPERAGRVVDESNLFSCFLVVVVALLVGFRPAADTVAWLWLLRPAGALFTLATTWLGMFFGLLAKTPEGAGAFSYILLLLLIFISPSFVPTDSMRPWLPLDGTRPGVVVLGVRWCIGAPCPGRCGQRTGGCLHPAQVESWLPGGVFQSMTGCSAKRWEPSGITRRTRGRRVLTCRGIFAGSVGPEVASSVADVAPNLACDLHVWRGSPNGVRTRVSTLRG